jgi:hypothetical protein
MERDQRPAHRRSGTLAATFKAVAASFFGVRARSSHEKDLSNLNPIHVIGVGIVLAAAFVVGLVLVVRLAVA